MLLLWPLHAASAPDAVPCDHRFGAAATWSHNTDQARACSFYYAEACAFLFNLPMTVFLSPFDGSASLEAPQLRAAADTGRVTFEVYFQTDRWQAPDAAGAWPRLPDYYAGQWSRAAVEAGFDVEPGSPKRTRFPNHGAQLFEVSGGRFGFDPAGNRLGRTDTLTGLIEHHREWIHTLFGYYPAAASYRNGQTGAAYAMPRFFLGVRNSASTGDLGYGRSPQREGLLLGGRAMDPPSRASHPSTTRAGDMDAPREEVLAHCAERLRAALDQGGWYRDFIHWHTNPRFETTLHDYFASQRRAMDGHDVAALDHGAALQHLVLRQMAAAALEADKEDLFLEVRFDSPGEAPLEAIRIPLSVRVNLSRTSLAGSHIRAPRAAGVRRLAENIFVIEVPFAGRGESVRLRIEREEGRPQYMDFSRPAIRNLRRRENDLLVETEQPTRIAVFSLPESMDLATYLPPTAQRAASPPSITPSGQTLELVARSNRPARRHHMDLSEARTTLAGRKLLVGIISEQRQSILIEVNESP